MIEYVFGLLADSTSVDESGKFSLVGEFSFIRASAVPVRHEQFSAIARWRADTTDIQGATADLEVEVVDASGNRLSQSPKISMPFPPLEQSVGKVQAQAILKFNGLTFGSYGTYEIRFRINNIDAGKVTFFVTPPPQP